MKHFLSTFLFIIFTSSILNAITTQDEVLVALEQLDSLFEADSIDMAIANLTEIIQELKLYNQNNLTFSQEDHAILEQKISEYEIALHKKLKNKAYGCLVVKKNLLANNLKVCNNTSLNNLTINGTLNGTFDLCGVSPCALVNGYALLLTATSADIPDTLVLRDGGSFAATTITLTGALQLQDSLGNIISLESATITAPYNLVLPDSTGTAGQFLSILSQSGDILTLGWVTSGGGSGTPFDIPNTLVQRDATGSFASTTITLTGCLVLQDETLATAGTLCANTVAVMLVPQGDRALQASTGGDQRGVNAIDLQINATSSQVASGDFAVIGGGQLNAALGRYAVVAGGLGNQALNPFDAIVSGSGNTVAGGFNFIGGGLNNSINTFGAVVVGGGFETFFAPWVGNSASGISSFIGSGIGNTINTGAAYSGIVSGSANTVQVNGSYCFIGAGQNNETSYADSVVGGINNNATGQYSFVGGGIGNIANGYSAIVVGGGFDGSNSAGNTASGPASFVGGGFGNIVNTGASYSGIVSGSGNSVVAGGQFCFVGGGFENAVNGPTGYIGGGSSNTIGTGANISTIVAGENNTINPFTGHSFIGGGFGNTIYATDFVAEGYSTIAGGKGNTINPGSIISFIGGGWNNQISGEGSVVCGGGNDGSNPPVGNQALSVSTFVGGGISNIINTSAAYSGIVSGSGNTVAVGCQYSFIGGGQKNIAANYYSVVGGGYRNIAVGQGAVVVGGGNDGSNPPTGNQAFGNASFIGAGILNQAQAAYDAVVSGSGNIASGPFALVGGGYANTASGGGSVVVGGGFDGTHYAGNSTGGNAACFIGGGLNNTVGEFCSYDTIVSGSTNSIGIVSLYNLIGSGVNNHIGNSNSGSQYCAIVIGYNNSIYDNLYSSIVSGSNNILHAPGSGTYSGNVIAGGASNQITGNYSAIPGGASNTVNGNYSFAAGQNANAANNNAFIWCDGSTLFTTTAANTFSVLATNGARFITNSAGTSGVILNGGGGSWNNLSDKTVKENYQPLDTIAILEKVIELPVETWNLTSESPEIKHMGPYAQDFYAAFGLGDNERYINSSDIDGVTLAALQGLYQLYTQEMATMKQEIAELKEKLALLTDN